MVAKRFPQNVWLKCFLTKVFSENVGQEYQHANAKQRIKNPTLTALKHDADNLPLI